MRTTERESSPRSVVHTERAAFVEAHMPGLKRRRGRSVVHMLFDREISSSRRAGRITGEMLRWSTAQWMRRPAQSSAYCEISNAKSTIALAISHDGEYFASTHGDHTVKVFRCSTWQHVCTLRGHERTPWTVKFHPHSRELLASGSLDQTVRMWHAASRTCIARHSFSYVVSCVSFHSSGEVLAVTAGKRISVWRWAPEPERIEKITQGHRSHRSGAEPRRRGQGGEASRSNREDEQDSRLSETVERILARQLVGTPSQPEVSVLLVGEQPQRCVAFKRAAASEMLFVAETNSEQPSQLPVHMSSDAHTAPPFTVQLRMWKIPPQLDELQPSRCTTQLSQLRVARSVMYSDAGFDVSQCGRFLTLCELDPQTGYHLRTYSLQQGSVGVAIQTVALPNCPYITSVQFSPLTVAVLIGYGRCQMQHGAPPQENPRYAVLRCVAFRTDLHSEERLEQLRRERDGPLPLAPPPDPISGPSDDLELFSVDSTDESNVALFHPHASACAQLAFVYATKDGRIRAFRFAPRSATQLDATAATALQLGESAASAMQLDGSSTSALHLGNSAVTVVPVDDR